MKKIQANIHVIKFLVNEINPFFQLHVFKFAHPDWRETQRVAYAVLYESAWHIFYPDPSFRATPSQLTDNEYFFNTVSVNGLNRDMLEYKIDRKKDAYSVDAAVVLWINSIGGDWI